MQKTRASLPFVIILPMVIATCALRFFQLLRQTDKATGYIIDGYSTTVVIYIFIALLFLLCIWYGVSREKPATAVAFSGEGKRLVISSALLSAGLFYDFVHQSFNCYEYISDNSFVQYEYVIPIGASALLALVSAGYFVAFLMNARATGVDFKGLKLFHIVPPAWVFARLCVLMTEVIDIRKSVESLCEFITLSSLLIYFLCLISAVDKKASPSTKPYVIFSAFSFSMCMIISIPRMLMILLRGLDSVSKMSFSASTYFFLGVFIVTMLIDLAARSRKQEM